MAAAQIPQTSPGSRRLGGAPAGAILPRSRFKVWVKRKRSGDADADWTFAPYLVPVAVTIAAAPSKSSATFRFHAGRIKREDEGAFRDYGRLGDVRDHFVKV